jgi:hypothetical protein
VLRLDSSLGIILNSLDLGWPDVRTSVVSRASQDGTVDTTSYIGARVITAELTLPASGYYAVEDQLRQVMHPAQRYWLHITRDDWTQERRVLVSGRSYTPSMGQPKTAQMVWAAPVGTFEGPQSSITLSPAMGSTGSGISFPKSFPISLTPGYAPGSAGVTVTGTAPTWPVVDIFGPCTNPSLFLAGTQQTLAFNLSIAAGDYLHVDFAARMALLNNNTSLSQYGRLDFLRSSWWVLKPGSQQVAFNPAAASGACQAVFRWSPRWI